MVRANAAMRLLVLITAWYYFALWGLVANKGLYARRRFGLGSRETAAQLSTFGLASTLSQVRLRVVVRGRVRVRVRVSVRVRVRGRGRGRGRVTAHTARRS